MTYNIELLKSKIHGASITDANLQYKGSLTLDEELMDAAGMVEYEKIMVVNNSNAERLETYLIKGARGSGVCCLNGAAARKAIAGDKVIIMSFLSIDAGFAAAWKPTKVFVDQNNEVEKIEIDK